MWYNFYKKRQPVWELVLPMLFIQSFAVAQTGFVPRPDHVLILTLENHSYEQIVGNVNMPYLNTLMDTSQAAVFTQSYALTHPSQPNYIIMFSGDQQGVTNSSIPVDTPFVTPNFGAALLQAGFTFAAYSEDLPYSGYLGAFYNNNLYARKHCPWTHWQHAPVNGIPDSLSMPFSYFPSNYDSLPDLCFVIPNQANDLHNNPNAAATYQTCDNWIQNNLGSYIEWCKTHNSIFVLTFDEDNYQGINHILTFLIGEPIQGGYYDAPVDFYNWLRTYLTMFSIQSFADAANSSAITNCWKICAPLASAALDGNTHICDLQQIYTAPFSEDAIYEWSVTGGEIISGQGTAEVTVLWGSEGGTIQVKVEE
ncbi:MAG: acid phosphatase [Sphingobacteriales bacterium]|nr:acid phosphatase [Sphingobacteriales bacterium]